MTAQRDPYVRVYYRVIDDPKFAEVYDNDARLSCWLRLLLIADATYPVPAPIPHGIKRSALDFLVSVRLVDLMAGNRFRLHGMDSERERQSLRGKAGAAARWDTEGNANAMRTQSEGNAPPETDAMHSAPLPPLPSAPLPPLRSNAHAPEDANGHRPSAYAALESVTLMPMERVEPTTLRELDRLRDQRGDPTVAAAIKDVAERIPTQPPAARQVVMEVVKELEPFTLAPSSGERKAQAKEDTEAADRERWAKERERTRLEIERLRSIGS